MEHAPCGLGALTHKQGPFGLALSLREHYGVEQGMTGEHGSHGMGVHVHDDVGSHGVEDDLLASLIRC